MSRLAHDLAAAHCTVVKVCKEAILVDVPQWLIERRKGSTIVHKFQLSETMLSQCLAIFLGKHNPPFHCQYEVEQLKKFHLLIEFSKTWSRNDVFSRLEKWQYNITLMELLNPHLRRRNHVRYLPMPVYLCKLSAWNNFHIHLHIFYFELNHILHLVLPLQNIGFTIIVMMKVKT